MGTAVKEAPKDDQVAEEVKARQMPLFVLLVYRIVG